MSPAFTALGWSLICGSVFFPVFVAAWIMLRSPGRAFALAAVFSAGALVAYVACGKLGARLIDPFGAHTEGFIVGFASAGAVGGGALATFIFGKLSRRSPWRRD